MSYPQGGLSSYLVLIRMNRQETKIEDLKGKIDFGIITVREDEFKAVLKRLPVEDMVTGRQTYAWSRLQTTKGNEYQIATIKCPEQGNLSGHSVATNLIEDLDPQWIILVGIAGSIPDYEYTLGDVVLATRLYDFCITAITEPGKRKISQQFNARGGAMHPEVLSLVAVISAIEPRLEGWNTPEALTVERPKVSFGSKKFYGDDKWKNKVRECLRKYFGSKSKRKNPIVFSGPIASSDTLVKSTQLAKSWLQYGKQINAVEMELAGVYQAAWNKQKPVLAIRGISDIVGFDRSPEWTEYACQTAASFMAALLRNQPVPPHSTGSVSIDAKNPKADTPNGTTTSINARQSSIFSSPPVNPAPILKQETLYSNLLKISYVPETIYSVNTHCSSRKHVWTLLRTKINNPPNDWIYKGHTLYSFHDFSHSIWKKVCDLDTVEPHKTTHWSNSTDSERIAEYIELLKGCLRELGTTRDLYYKHRSPFRFFYFAPTKDLSPRTVATKSLKRIGSHTVFQAYRHPKTNNLRYYRHHAFHPDFYRFDNQWYLEINPTYHYTNDGYKTYRYYEKEISGIKRQENNEAVFRQVLFWSEVLRDDESNFLQQQDKYPHLKFGDLLKYSFPYGIHDDEWKKKDSINKDTLANEENLLFI
jgi:nucleoside phosphorylase